MKFSRVYQLACFALSISVLWLSYNKYQNTRYITATTVSAYQKQELISESLVPVLNTEFSDQQSINFLATISAESIYAMDLDSGTVLLDKNSSQVKAPASTTKLLTALVARKVYDLEQVLQVTNESSVDGNTIGLFNGEKIKVRDLIYASLVQSGNDAAFTLADNYPLGFDEYMKQMNLWAGKLGLSNTYFTNPAGLDNQYHQSTARDLAILTKEVLKDDFLKSVISTKSININDESGVYHHQLYTTNSLLGKQGVIGGKTGTTENAGEALITEVENDGHHLVIVVLASEDRYSDTSKIIDFIFSNYNWLSIEQLINS